MVRQATARIIASSNNMPKIVRIVIIKAKLTRNNIKSPILDSEILMSKAINRSKKFIITNLGSTVEKNSLRNFKRFVFQRARGKPVSYITGTKEFWKFQFKNEISALFIVVENKS